MKADDPFKINRNFAHIIAENNAYRISIKEQRGFKLGLGYERLFKFSSPDVFWGIGLNCSYNSIYAKINLNSNNASLTREFYNKSVDFQPGVSVNSLKKISKNYYIITKLSALISFESLISSIIKTSLNDSIIDNRSQKKIQITPNHYSLRFLARLELNFPISKTKNKIMFVGVGFTFIENIKTLLFESKPFTPLLRFSYTF